jgi:hypothetical protein
MFQTRRSWLSGAPRKARSTSRPKKVAPPRLESLGGRIVPTVQLTAAGAGLGTAGIVTVFNTDGSSVARWKRYERDLADLFAALPVGEST